MAQKVVTTLVDDLDGTVIEEGGGETLRFAIDGASYEIDLTKDNAQRLRDALAPYVDVARGFGSASASRGRAQAPSSNNSKEELSAARQWLRAEGHNVSDRGRIQNDLLELFRNAKK